MQTRSASQFFLRDPEFVPVKSYRSTKLFLYVNLTPRSPCISHDYNPGDNRL